MNLEGQVGMNERGVSLLGLPSPHPRLGLTRQKRVCSRLWGPGARDPGVGSISSPEAPLPDL